MIEHLDINIAMRDSVTLVGDLFRPDDGKPCPLILELTPYGKGPDKLNFRGESEYWTKHGFAFLIVDCRGQNKSGGTFSFIGGDGPDAYDIIEWAARQSWCTGRVGMRGASYTGSNQWQAAREHPPHLTCLVPCCATKNGLEEVVYPGGAFHLVWALAWANNLSSNGIPLATPIDWEKLKTHRPLATLDEAAFGRTSPGYKRTINEPQTDYWQRMRMIDDDYRSITQPTLSFSGWLDGTLEGTVRNFQEIQEHARAKDQHFLILGPWGHMPAPDGGFSFLTGKPVNHVGDLVLPDHAFLPGQEITRAYYDWCLKGGPRPDLPPVKIYLTGSNRWVDLPSFPAPNVKPTPLYFDSAGNANGKRGDGKLRWNTPEGQPSDEYVFDPANPLPSEAPNREGTVNVLNEWPVDLTPLIDRPDVLVYVSDPMKKPVTIAGSVTVVAYASSDARDTDFVALIEDVGPDGFGIKLGSKPAGVVRARHRNGLDREELLTPGKPEQFNIYCGHFGHTFMPGHRIRISVASSLYPRFSINPNTGNPIATDTAEPRKARQRIFHDAARASHVMLPVMPEG
jgi:uncharacterized protein